MLFDQLFAEAVHLTASATSTPSAEHVPTLAEVAAHAADAQRKLLAALRARLPDTVLAAAREGKTSAIALVFNGTEKFESQSPDYEDFSILFLLRGPRDRGQLEALYCCGFVPLLETLHAELAPFKVQHSWVPGSNANHVTVYWA